MAETTIEWTRGPRGEPGYTFNGWIGCEKVSPGCLNCYAAAQDKFRGWTSEGWGGPRRRTSPANWRKPKTWNDAAAAAGERRKVFCSSLADVFDNQVPREWRADLFRLILDTPHLDWLLLTKRIGNVRKMIDDDQWEHLGNVWLGATVVNQEEADRDIPKLLATPARVRFLSMEPLLGPVDLRKWLDPWTCADCEFHGSENDCGPDGCEKCGTADAFSAGDVCKTCGADDQAAKPACPNCGSHRSYERDAGFKFDSERKLIDWVIVGGESGHGARPFDVAWARSIVAQCRAAGVPVMVKQLGAHVITNGISEPGQHWPRASGKHDTGLGHFRKHLVDRKGGDWSEWPQDLRVREFPEVPRCA